MIKSKIQSFRLFLARHKILEACLVAFILIVATFPDVLFRGTSLRMTDQIIAHQANTRPQTVYPLPNSTGWHAGYNDAGGAVFQSEPMIEFMRYCIKTGQSPYWNPYSAAGSLGPETLVDQKFSALTLSNAVLGDKSLVYNSIMIFLLYFSIFFIYRVAREKLELSALSSIGVAIFYLLNGYSIANLGSNVTQSYLYIPMCLYVALNFIDTANITRFVAIVFSFAILLSCTFIPTTLVSLIAIYTIIIGYIFVKINQHTLSYRSGMALLALQVMGIIISILLLSVLYIPILENISSLGVIENYNKRVFYPLFFPQALASLFSSTHFFELYNAMEPAAYLFKTPGHTGYINGNVVYHISVLAIAFAGCCLSLQRTKFRPLIIISVLCILFTFWRMFEGYFSDFFSYIPIVGHIGCQYWWAPIMISMAILVGFGIDNLQRHNARIMPALFFIATGVGLMFQIYEMFGFHEPHIQFKLGALLFLSVLTTITIAALFTLRFTKSNSLPRLILYSLLALMFIELMVHSKMLRHKRNDFFLNPPGAIAYVRKNVGLYRALNFGGVGLYPELGSAFQIQDITAMNEGTLPSYLDYFNSAIKLGASETAGDFPTLRIIQDEPSSHKFNWPALNLLGVKYIILLPYRYVAYKDELIRQGMKVVYETPLVLVFENPHVLPRAFAIELPNNNNEVSPSMTLPADFSHHIHQAQITTYQNTVVEIKGTALTRMLVVLTDNWHQNWSATMNGVEVPIIKVNGTFRGVIVPPGNYIIKMHYQPRTLHLAIGISSGVLLLLIAMILGRRRLDQFIGRRLRFWT